MASKPAPKPARAPAAPDPAPDTFRGDDGLQRCFWAQDEALRAYHDAEWGLPVTDDTRLFEKLCLEGFQSGLSWRTILLRREGFRRAFAGFEIPRVARFPASKVEKLLQDASIIRHRGKIEATIQNARAAQALIAEAGSLAAHVWGFEPAREGPPPTRATIPSTSPASIALSKDLRRRGFAFVGPTTAYAFLQAMGLVNDHVGGCAFRGRAEAARRALGAAPGRPRGGSERGS